TAGAVAELAAGVGAPAGEAAVGAQGAGVSSPAAPGGDRGAARQRDRARRRRRMGRATSELAVGPGPPAGDGTVGLYRAGEARPERDPARGPRQRGGGGSCDGSFFVPPPPPAEDGAVRLAGPRRGPAGRHVG